MNKKVIEVSVVNLEIIQKTDSLQNNFHDQRNKEGLIKSCTIKAL